MYTTYGPRFLCLLVVMCVAASPGFAQDAVPTASSVDDLARSVHDLQQEVRNLRSAVAEMRDEVTSSREQTAGLRRDLEAARGEASSPSAPGPRSQGGPTGADSTEGFAYPGQTPGGDPASSQGRADRLDEDYQLLAGKIDDQYQTKVESWSKYRVRFSGIVLFNLFNDQGSVDNTDFPSLAFPSAPGASGGSFGATLRQSQLGFEVSGPRFAGARMSADVRFDFGGGFGGTPNAVNYGLSWLRTGTLRFDWNRTSVVAGQDALFFSPISPTSFASLSVPALSYAGNLWSWTPQIRIEHRVDLSDGSSLSVQAGILDNLDGAPPSASSYRQPQAGEASRQPAYASRLAWSHTIFGQSLTIGSAGYYGRQNYGFNRNVDGWAAMTDWTVPLNARFTLSGKFYRGRAVGGLTGGIGSSVLTNGDPANPATAIRALNSSGGWAQIKFRPRSTIEMNAAVGEDNPFASDVRYFPAANSPSSYPGVIRNQGSLANVIFRPRSDLLFSAEYHYLKTFAASNQSFTAGQINLIMGVLF